jgi:hypothetical protein
MVNDKENLMSLMEKKKRELEDQVEALKGKHSGLVTKDATKIKENLDELEQYLNEGKENLSDKQMDDLKKWLPIGCLSKK